MTDPEKPAETHVTPEQADAMLIQNQPETEQAELNVNTEMEQAVSDEEDNNYQDMTVEELIQFQLNHKEKSEAAETLVQLFSEKAIVEKERKEVKKEYEARLNQFDASIDSVLEKVENGEERMTSCIKRVYFSKRVVEFSTVNEDGTRNIVRTRKMEEDDKQLTLSEPVQANSFVSDEDARAAGAAIPTEADPFDDSDEELEKVTESMLTENTPTTF